MVLLILMVGRVCGVSGGGWVSFSDGGVGDVTSDSNGDGCCDSNSFLMTIVVVLGRCKVMR